MTLVSYEPPIKKKMARAINDLEQAAALQRRNLVEAATTERASIEADETNRAYRVERRIDNGYQLSARTAHHATQLNRQVSLVTRDNPAHELALRGLEETTLFGAQSLIYGYMTR